MILNKIKDKTTWSDASATLNENFARILKGIRDGIPTIETPVDEQMSDESENAVQNKVIKKYVDDEVVYMEGYSEEKVRELEKNIKANPSQYVQLKTINGKSLFGAGNIVIEGGEGGSGLQYAIERTVYPTEFRLGDYSETFEISEEGRAYNAETFEKTLNHEPVFVSIAGFLLQHTFDGIDDSTGEACIRFNLVVDMEESGIFNGLVSITVTVHSNGDAILEYAPLNTGSAPSAPRDMNSDFNNDF